MTNQFNRLESCKSHQWQDRLIPWLKTGSRAILMMGALTMVPYSANAEEMDLSALQLNGSASINNGVLRLTPAQPDQAGSAFTKNKRNINGGFSTFFNFQITNAGAGGAADGLVFVIQPHGPDYIGNPSYALGFWDGNYDRKSVGVEIDTYKSGVWAGDNNDNHLAINTQGNLTGWATARVEPSFQDDTLIWYGWIDYDGRQLEVRINPTNQRPSNPYLSYPIDIQTLVGENDAFVGFTGGTGGAYANFDILSWQFVEKFAPITPEPDGESTAACEADKQSLQQALDDANAKLAAMEQSQTETQAQLQACQQSASQETKTIKGNFTWWKTSGDSTTIDDVKITLQTVQVERFGASSIRDLTDNTAMNEGELVFTFSRPIQSFTGHFSYFSSFEEVYDFNFPPTAVSGNLKPKDTSSMAIITSSSSGDTGTGTISWTGLATTTLSFKMGTMGEGKGAIAFDSFEFQTLSPQAQCQADKQTLQQALDDANAKLAACETAKTDAEKAKADSDAKLANCESAATTLPSSLKDSLVAYYPFDGNTEDASGHEFHGEPYGVTPAEGKLGEAYSFNGTDARIKLPASIIQGTELTVDFWFKTPNNVHQSLISGAKSDAGNNEYVVFLQPGKLELDYHNATNQDTILNYADNQWHRLTVVTQTNQSQVYVDNLPPQTIQFGSKTPFDIKGLWLGGEQDKVNGGWDSKQQFKGSIDELRFYNRALSQTEIQELYQQSPENTEAKLAACETAKADAEKAKADSDAKLAACETAKTDTEAKLTACEQTNAQCPTLPSLNDGLVAHYPFSGNAQDATGHGNNGTVNGAALTTDRFGNANSAYQFDGVDDSIIVQDGSQFNFTNNLSLSLWVNPGLSNSTLSNAGLIDKSHSHNSNNGVQKSWTILQNGDQTNAFRFNYCSQNNSYSSAAAWFEPKVWNHLFVSKENGTVKLYKNGTLISTYNGPSAIEPNENNPLLIGAVNNWNRFFNGMIDDVRIYSRALSQAEVQVLYKKEAVDLNDGLVAYYPFNGNAQDATENGNHGTVHEATLTMDRFGNPNSAYQFDGVDDYVKTPVDVQGKAMPTTTWSAWVRPTRINHNQWQGILSTDDGGWDRSLHIPQNGSTFSTFTGSTYWAPVAVEINQWQHIVVVYSPDNMLLYKNGIQFHRQPASGLQPTVNTLHIGKSPNGTPIQAYQGDIDEVRIYNRALSATEIQALYEQPHLNDGLVAHYPFNGNAQDATGHGNNGAVNGATLTTDRFGNANSAYVFDGVNDSIRIEDGSQFTFTNQLTVSLWLKPGQSQSEHAGLIDKSHGHPPNNNDPKSWVIQQQGTQTNVFRFNYTSPPQKGYSFGDSLFEPNIWNHLVVSKNNNVIQVYKNGTLVARKDDSPEIRTNGNLPLLIGAVNGFERYFNGMIDDIRIYNRALSQAEVQVLHQQEAQPKPVNLNDGLVAYYPFNGNAQDATGNGNHGTVTGATIKEGVVYLSESQSTNSFVTFGNQIDQFQTNDFSVVFHFRTQEKSRLFDLAGDRTAAAHGNFLDIRMTGLHESIPEGTVTVDVDQDSHGTNYIGVQSTTHGLNDGKWHQVVAIRMGQSLSLYIDGKLEKTASGNGVANISNSNPFKLGRSYAGFPNAVVQYDNLRIYNRALSQAEAQALYKQQP